jgi:RNA polymerase sigma-70 factor (ECF subfamily)
MRSQESPSTSPSLIRNARAGNEQAWNELVQIYGPLVLRWTQRYRIDKTDADDITQNVFLTISKNLQYFGQNSGQHSFRGWLWTITRSKILDHFRIKRKLPESMQADQLANALGLQELSLDEQTQVDQHDDLKIIVHAAMELIRGDFSEKTWQAFYRTVALGEAPSEVARDLQMTSAAVCMCRGRVLKRLRETIDEI